MKKDCDKAAQILRGFVDKGKIPKEVIANAKGLAIFSAFRAGMWLAGTGGSGVVVARLPDGSWSPPAAFSVRAGGIGLVYGIDVYDCVCVLNTQDAVDAYTRSETTLGGGIQLAAGPIGGNANTKDVKPVWTYTRSKGLYGGVTVDSTVIKEKVDENAEFYGSRIATKQILKGNVVARGGVKEWPAGAKQLTEVLKMVEGKSADAKVLQEISTEPTPGDLKE